MNWVVITAILACAYGSLVCAFMFAVMWEDVKKNDWDKDRC